MDKKTAQALHSWFDSLAKSIGATGDGKRYYDNRDLIELPNTESEHSYGYALNTKYGVLTFRLDAESGHNTTITVFAKFLEPEKLEACTSKGVFSQRSVIVNGLHADTYNGKWNLHLGVCEIPRAKECIKTMLSLSDLTN